jgi:hypothetical protein
MNTEYLRPTSRALGDGVQFLQEVDRVLALAIRGIVSLQGVGDLVEALAEYDGKPTLTDETKEAHEMSRLAAEEVASDFPLLRAHTVVAMWSALETIIPSFAAVAR